MSGFPRARSKTPVDGSKKKKNSSSKRNKSARKSRSTESRKGETQKKQGTTSTRSPEKKKSLIELVKSVTLARKIISQEELETIQHHKFKSGEPTPIDKYIMQPTWRTLCNTCLPTWLHPNLITLTGSIPLMALYFVFAQSNPEMGSDERWMPDYMILLAVLAELFYQTMDGIDGIQARRIGVASVLGCLFDHGCDCIATIAHCELVLSLLPGASVQMLLLAQVFSHTTFFMAQWKHRMTGVHHINCGPIGVTELQDTIIFLLLLKAYLGEAAWRSALEAPSMVDGWNTRDAGVLGFLVVLTAINLIEIPAVFWKHCNNAQEVWQGAKQFLPLFLINAIFLNFPSELLSATPAARLISFLYALQSVQITIEEIISTAAESSLKFRQQYGLLISTALLGFTHLDCYLNKEESIFGEVIIPADNISLQIDLLWLCVFLQVGLFVSWVTSVTLQLRNQLGIRVFHTTGMKKDMDRTTKRD